MIKRESKSDDKKRGGVEKWENVEKMREGNKKRQKEGTKERERKEKEGGGKKREKRKAVRVRSRRD